MASLLNSRPFSFSKGCDVSKPIRFPELTRAVGAHVSTAPKVREGGLRGQLVLDRLGLEADQVALGVGAEGLEPVPAVGNRRLYEQHRA